jgi:hypothetical protein
MIVGRFTNLPNNQKVWRIEFAFDSNGCDGSEQQNWSYEIIDLTKGSYFSE